VEVPVATVVRLRLPLVPGLLLETLLGGGGGIDPPTVDLEDGGAIAQCGVTLQRKSFGCCCCEVTIELNEGEKRILQDGFSNMRDC
jgi:hypothetical protein